MYFGNSRVNINTSIGCDIYNLTRKNFVVEIETGVYKDNVFIGYIKDCLNNFQEIKNFFDFTNGCLRNAGNSVRWYECYANYFQNPIQEQLPLDCNNLIANIEGLKVIYNTFSGINQIDGSCFRTTRNSLPDYNQNDWGCPNNFKEREKTRLNLGCYSYFDVETLGINFSEEIKPCNFLFFSDQCEASSTLLPFDYIPATVNIYYLDGEGKCNMITLSKPADPCLNTVVCWPPSGVNPWGNIDIDPCSPEGCAEAGGIFGGDICSFNRTVSNVSPRCRCPQSVPCFERPDDYSNRNCFTYPGISSGEPCVDGSWDGSSCTSGYNGVCISGTCVNRICKELDWIIDNYAGASEGFTGYASFVEQFSNEPTVYQQLKDWYYLSCSPKSVEIINDINQPITVTFGDTPTQRSWDRIIYRLSQFAKNGIEDKFQTKLYLPFSESGCSSGYPIQVCCLPISPGSVNYDCPVCPITGFADNYEEPTCCCDESITPLLFGLGNAFGIGAPDNSEDDGGGGGGGGGPGLGL